MLLASWLLGPIDALRAVATFHYLIAALGTYALARPLRASRTGSAFGAIAFAASGRLVARSAALGLLGGAAWLAPRWRSRRRRPARPSRRGLAIAGLALVLALHLAERLAAAGCAHARDLVRSGWSRAPARAGRATRVIAFVLAFGLAAVALVPRLELLRFATASGYVDPDGIGSLLFGDRRGARRSLRPLALRDRDALPRRGDARARAHRLPARPARRLRVRLLGWLIAFSVAWAPGLVGWLMDPLPLVRTVAGHEPVRGIVLGLLCACVLAAFALPEAKRWPGASSVAALGSLDRRPPRAAATASR